MKHCDAVRILDRVKDGWLFSESTISRALFMTGDLDEHELERMDARMRGSRMGDALQEKAPRGWTQ